MVTVFDEKAGPDCSQWLAIQGKPYPRTCRTCGLGPCKRITNKTEMAPAAPEGGPITMQTGAFTPEELIEVERNPEAERLLFGAAPEHWTVGRLRHEVRLLLTPPTAANRLHDMLGELALSPERAEIIATAILELDSLALVNTLRPIADLRQEAFKHLGRNATQSSPYRWVLLWGPSGYQGSAMNGFVGRRQPDGMKFAGQFVGRDYELFSSFGFSPTHFSEIPLGALSDA